MITNRLIAIVAFIFLLVDRDDFAEDCRLLYETAAESHQR